MARFAGGVTAAADRADGAGLPEFIAREFREFLTCGVLAPHAHWRPEVVAYRRVESDEATGPSAAAGRAGPGRWGGKRPRYWTWAALMRRAFDLDVLRCPRCAGGMQLIATIDDPAFIQLILAHLELPGARDGPPPPAAVSAARAEQRALPYVTR
ncbi:MAG: hypothetical protein Q7W02_06480 [Candidatus Rokubacteria bacterium]|nr:hypothetical protein [Candidatus Rokubacteria bacterium]